MTDDETPTVYYPLSVLRELEHEPVAEVVALLEDTLRRARAGEIIGVALAWLTVVSTAPGLLLMAVSVGGGQALIFPSTVALVDGGDDQLTNLRAICRAHHRIKSEQERLRALRNRKRA